MTFPKRNLSADQLEELLLYTEQKARKYIHSQVPPKEITHLDISIQFDISDELKLDCVIEIELVKQSKLDPQKISDEAVNEVIEIIENELKLGPH